MQESVEDEEHWGESSVALEEMGVTVLAGEPATWCGLVGGLTERERGTV